MTRPTLFEDVQKVVEAMRTGGRDAASAEFARLAKERSLLQWEASVFRDKARQAMIDAGLLSDAKAKPDTASAEERRAD
jgi:hypothetical protein